MLGDVFQLHRVHVDGDDGGAQGVRHLHRVAAYPAHADDDGDIAGLDFCLHRGLVRGGHRVGHDRDVGKLKPCRGKALLVDRAKGLRRNDDVGGEAAVDIVARHLLRAADGAVAGEAEVAFAAGDDRRNQHRLADPLAGPLARRDHAAADLVSQRERSGVVEADAAVIETKVGVADAAAGDLDDDFSRARRRGKFTLLHRLTYGGHGPAIR